MSPSPLPSTFTFKLTLPSLTDTNHTTRLLLLPCNPSLSWSSLANTIQSRFSLPSPPSALTYLDDSDDEITLSSDAELAEFLLDVQDDQEIKLTVLRAPEQEPKQRTAESLLDSLRSALKQDHSPVGPVHRVLRNCVHRQRHHPYASADFGPRRGGGRGRGAQRREQTVEVDELVLSDSESNSDSVASEESITEAQMSDESRSESESEPEEQDQPPRRRRPSPSSRHHNHHRHHNRGHSFHTKKHPHRSSRPFNEHHRPPFPPHAAFDLAPPPLARHTRFPSSSPFDLDFPPHDGFDLDMSPEHEHGFRRPGRGRRGFGGRGRGGRWGRGGFGGRGDRMML